MDEKYWGFPAPEAALVDQAQRGRLEAYNRLVLRHQARAYNTAYYLLGDAESAADAVQDSFLKAYRRLDQFRGGAFEAWLLRIVVNTCYDELRKRRRRSAHVVEVATGDDDNGDADEKLRDPGEWPEQTILRRELLEEVRAAIGALPPDQRTVLVLSDVEGWGYQEIAAVAGIPIGTVKSRLARARGRVRALVQTGPEARTRRAEPTGPVFAGKPTRSVQSAD